MKRQWKDTARQWKVRQWEDTVRQWQVRQWKDTARQWQVRQWKGQHLDIGVECVELSHELSDLKGSGTPR